MVNVKKNIIFLWIFDDEKTPPAISAACYEICSLAEKQAQNIGRDEWFTIKDEKLPNVYKIL